MATSVLVCLLCSVLGTGPVIVFSGDIVITLQPENLSLSPDTSAAGGRLTVTCSATSLGSGETLIAISVARTAVGSSEVTGIVTWIPGSNMLRRNDSIPAMTVTNSSTPSSRTVVVTMERTKCEDAGNYACKANIVTGTGASDTPSAFKTLDVEVTPGNITLIPDPKGKTDWTEGQTLTLPCSGSVGTVVKNVTQIKWVWEYRDGNNPSSQWMSYGQTSDIQSGPPVTRECYERWSSTLTRVLTFSDTGREYRCYIQRNSLSFTQFAATHYVGTVNPVFSGNMDITLQPENLSLSPDTSAAGGRLTVTCSATSLGSEELLISLSVARTAVGSSEVTHVVTWIPCANTLRRNDSIPAMTVTNSSTPSSRTVVVTMERTKCEDAGNYTCKANIVTDTGASATHSTFKTLDVEVTPGNITLIPDPKGKTEWTEGQTLRLPCSGSVGTVVKNVTQIKWVWEYRDGNNPSSQWMSYGQTSDIQSGPPVTRECYEWWSSTLTRVLTFSDTGREYRCYIQRNSLSFTQLAAIHYVGTVKPGNIDITLQPENLSLSRDTSAAGGRLTVTCSATSLGSDELLISLSVARTVIHTSEETSVVTWVPGFNILRRNDSIAAMTVTSSSTPSSSTVVVTMERTKCEDAGNYTCKANIVTATGSSVTPSTFKTLDVEVTPGNITIIPDPMGKTEWAEGETLTLPCIGSVGTVVTGVTQMSLHLDQKRTWKIPTVFRMTRTKVISSS